MLKIFDQIKLEIQKKYNLDEKNWVFYYYDKCFYLFKNSWRRLDDKNGRGLYSFTIENHVGSGFVRNSNVANILRDEEQEIYQILEKNKGGLIHSISKEENSWFLLWNKSKLFSFPDDDKKICNYDSSHFKSLVDDCVQRLDDLLTLLKETELEHAIDKCIELRRQSNKI